MLLRNCGYAIAGFILIIICNSASLWADHSGESIKIASWNIEMMTKMFDQYQMPERAQNTTELWRDEEDLYEIKRTIGLPEMQPDILIIVECCRQDWLEYVNREWLGDAYQFVKVFEGNTEGQYVAMMAKNGFEPVEIRDRYFLEKDPEPARENESGRLFSRGVAFVQFRSPKGHLFWVGGTHAKSKYNNNTYVTRWRIREMERTRVICSEILAESAVKDLVLLGDFNDSFGKDDYEERVGSDALEVMLKGEDQEKLVSLTLPLVEADPLLATYHCELKPVRYRSFIDHIFASQQMAARCRLVDVIDDPIAAVASDHYPLVGTFVFDDSGQGK